MYTPPWTSVCTCKVDFMFFIILRKTFSKHHEHRKYHCKFMKNIKSTLQVHFWWYIMFCSHMCKDINDKNTKPKKLISRARFRFRNTHTKNAWKTFENLEIYTETEKTIVTDQKMVKLVLQHEQIDNVKPSTVEDLHYFPIKYQNHHLKNTKTWNQVYLILVDDTERFVTCDFCCCKQKHNEYQNYTHNLQSSFDSILIVFSNITVFCVIFDYRECFDIHSFFIILAFHINDIVHDFSAFSFDAAHDDYNNLNFCIYCHFNCVLGKITDIMCIFPDLFYAQINIHNKMYQNHQMHYAWKTSKNISCTTNNHDNFQNKQEYCTWKTIYITTHSKNENHVKNAFKSW